MKLLLISTISFLSGSLMFSLWIGWIKGVDIRMVRDGNPGAFNLWHATGPITGLLGVLLDFLKGFLPVYITIHFQLISGLEVIIVGLCPILGHIFSPFLKFKGGKAIAVSFGVWSGLTSFRVSLIWALSLLFLLLISKFIFKKQTSPLNSAIIILLGMPLTAIYMVITGFHPLYIYIFIINFLLLVYTHRLEVIELTTPLMKGE